MTYDEIKEICLKYNIENWSLNEETGLVDVDGGVGLSWKNLTELPLNFGNVKGYFWCDNNLTTLKGAPNFVGGNFYCHNNNITTRHKLPNVDAYILCDKNMKWIF